MIPIIWKKGGILLGVVTLVLLIFSGVRHNEFVQLDDDVHISENRLMNPPSWGGFAEVWKYPFQGLYVPVTYATWMLTALASGGTPSPYPFHTLNWALHAANAGWVYLIISLLTGAGLPAALAALAFAVHPLQAEAVSWASATKDVLAGFFGLAALYVHLRQRALPWRSWGHLAPTAYFALAMLAKPSAVVLLLIALFLKMARGTTWKTAVPPLVPWAAVALPLLWITKTAQPDSTLLAVPSLPQRLVVLSDTVVFYLSKVAFPFALGPDYGREPTKILGGHGVYLSLSGLLALAWLAWRAARSLALPLVIFLSGVLPVAGLVPFYFQNYSTVADRYTYLSLLAIALTMAIWLGPKPGLFRSGVATAMLSLWTLLTLNQLPNWRTSETLFAHALKVNPNSVLAHTNLGTVLEKRGDLGRALFHYEQAIAVHPESLPAYFNAGRIHALQGNFEKAERYLLRAARATERSSDAHFSLGLLYRQRGDPRRADTHFHLAGRRPRG